VLRRRGRCSSCGSLGDAWVLDGWRSVCSDCAYEIEYGPTERVPQQQPDNHPPQDERLFDPDEAAR
jgi:hypothetical protein